MHSCVTSRAAESAAGGWTNRTPHWLRRYRVTGGLNTDCASGRQHSRRHVVYAVAGVADQHQVSVQVIHSGVVGHVRGARHFDFASGKLGVIVDHRATLTDVNPESRGLHRRSCRLRSQWRKSRPRWPVPRWQAGDPNHGIALHDPRGDYPKCSRGSRCRTHALPQPSRRCPQGRPRYRNQ